MTPQQWALTLLMGALLVYATRRWLVVLLVAALIGAFLMGVFTGPDPLELMP